MSAYNNCARYNACRPAAAPAVPDSITPELALVQLMSLLDPIINAASSSSRAPKPPVHKTTTYRTVFTPRFDVQETAVEYILEGEFPGLSDKSKLDIQFTDHKTLSVRGALEKKIPEQNDTPKEATSSGSLEKKLLNPTVEDTDDESDNASTDSFEIVDRPSSSSSKKPYEKPSGPASIPTKKIVIENTLTIKPKTWVSERAFGPFQRTFSFPGVVDIENVSASLEAGLLRIRVPKKTQLATRKITII
ncbi:HSP20-like chaperone [Morchella snyderi]|nr:HSP20-like chaperone [Morchella snyderi]